MLAQDLLIIVRTVLAASIRVMMQPSTAKPCSLPRCFLRNQLEAVGFTRSPIPPNPCIQALRGTTWLAYVHTLFLPHSMHIRPYLHGQRTTIRLSDLSGASFLQTTCGRCRRLDNVAPYRLLGKFPAGMRMVDVMKHYHCRSCKATEPVQWQTFVVVSPNRLPDE